MICIAPCRLRPSLVLQHGGSCSPPLRSLWPGPGGVLNTRSGVCKDLLFDDHYIYCSCFPQTWTWPPCPRRSNSEASATATTTTRKRMCRRARTLERLMRFRKVSKKNVAGHPVHVKQTNVGVAYALQRYIVFALWRYCVLFIGGVLRGGCPATQRCSNSSMLSPGPTSTNGTGYPHLGGPQQPKWMNSNRF